MFEPRRSTDQTSEREKRRRGLGERVLTVLSVFGTRPEAIKMAPVIRRLGEHSGEIRSVICSVGQHREMLNQVLPLFGIRPDYDLDLMQPDQSLAQLSAALFTGLDRVIREVLAFFA